MDSTTLAKQRGTPVDATSSRKASSVEAFSRANSFRRTYSRNSYPYEKYQNVFQRIWCMMKLNRVQKVSPDSLTLSRTVSRCIPVLPPGSPEAKPAVRSALQARDAKSSSSRASRREAVVTPKAAAAVAVKAEPVVNTSSSQRFQGVGKVQGDKISTYAEPKTPPQFRTPRQPPPPPPTPAETWFQSFRSPPKAPRNLWLEPLGSGGKPSLPNSPWLEPTSPWKASQSTNNVPALRSLGTRTFLSLSLSMVLILF